MTGRWYLILPLCSSVLYVIAAVGLRRAAAAGVGPWRGAFVINLCGAVVFLPLWFLGGPGQPPTQLWQPALAALVMVIGQCFTLLSLTRGDVSLATPVLGAKTILVAAFTTLLAGREVAPQLWVGAALSTLGITVLNRGGAGHHEHAPFTVLTALTAAAAFAVFDVLVMTWSPRWGAGRFLPIMNLAAAAFSLGLIPLFRQPLRALSEATWRWLLWGAAMVALQGVLLVTTVAVFGDATAVNIVYSARGLWSVAALWWLGSWLGSDEATRGADVLGWRLAGAGLMTAAIVTVFV